jgi:hypothetical protein
MGKIIQVVSTQETEEWNYGQLQSGLVCLTPADFRAVTSIYCRIPERATVSLDGWMGPVAATKYYG